jgi:integrase/recombinase XerD
MTHNTKPVSPLRQRMIEDMALRKLAPKTQSHYLRAVINLTCFLGRSPDTASPEDLRRYQLHLVETGTSSIMLNHTITALRFFFAVTLDRPEALARMSPVREPRKLPVVLSCEEVARLIEAAATPKYQAALSVAYGAGLRASEVIAIKVGDIDSTRMTLRVENVREGSFLSLSHWLYKRWRSQWVGATPARDSDPRSWPSKSI